MKHCKKLKFFNCQNLLLKKKLVIKQNLWAPKASPERATKHLIKKPSSCIQNILSIGGKKGDNP